MSEGAPLRVLSVAHTAVSREAGRLRYHPLASASDLDVHLLVPARWHQFGRAIVADPPDDPGVTVHVRPVVLGRGGRFSWYLHLSPSLPGLLRRIRPHVLHLWEEPWSLVALEAALLRGTAALVLEVDQNILKRLPPPFEAIRRFVLGRTSLVLARSPDAAEVVRARGYSGPIRFVGYGVDRETFRPGDPPDHPVAGPDGPLRLGYVGRLVAEKGLDDALAAMSLARCPAMLTIMGEGPYEESLRARANELGLGARVIFTPWGAPAEVADFLRGLDALLLLTRTTASVKEQFGRVILEAQSCGVPVIGSMGGAIPDVVGEGGWIVPESDPQSLARLLDRLAAAPGERRARGEAGLRNVEARFTYTAIARVLAEAWREAARGGARP